MSVTFTVPGRVPSKANYRHSKETRSQWQRIKQYEQEVGLSAIAAGARQLRSYADGKARLKVLLVNQVCDLDNALKCPIDGLKGVAFPDDSPEHLEAVQVCWVEDEGPARVEYRISR